MKSKYFRQVLWLVVLVVMVVSSVCAVQAKDNVSSKSFGNEKNATENLKSKQQASYPIDSTVLTTLDRMIVPVAVSSIAPIILPTEISKFSQYGYGIWQFGPGLGYEKRLDIMSPSYSTSSATNGAKLLNFFTMSDIHLTDKESPTQAIYFGYKGGIISAYSPIMLYTTHVLDAAVQTVNALNKNNKFDFGIALGDIANSTQYNELRWFIDIFDGKKINPDTGVKDDPIKGPLNDYQDEYKAAGIDKSIPWYVALGNHDHFWIGTNPVDDYIRPYYTGEDILNMGNIFLVGGFKNRGFYMGSMNGRTIYGDVYGTGPVKEFAKPPKVLAADPKRRSLLRHEWMSEFFNTSSNPKGHGFSKENAAKGFPCYSFEPNSNIPIKVIVLDDTQRENDPDIHGYGHGTLDKERYDWLVNELDKGQSEGKLMIIAAHVPIGVEKPDSYIGWWSNAYVLESSLIEKLHEYPNLLMWIAGHRHLNAITAFKSPDANRPELGFWQVETPSLREFPQQFRTFEIARNSDKTISIFATDVDPAVKDGSFAAISRSYAIAANQIFKLPTDNLSYNAELVKQLSPEMQEKIQKYVTLKQQ